VCLAPRCPGSARTSWAFSPASIPLHRCSLPPPQSSFPTPFPSFLLFPHPSSGPRAPAVLTARVTFHHRILQERDLLDLRADEGAPSRPAAPRWSPEVLAASVGPGLHLHPQGPLMGDATTPSSLANHHPSPPPGPSKPTPLLQLHPPPDFLAQSLER
ncbi:hypothetical protein LEMLEM_LOCUS15670, partial [Lemmus lemmus]